MKRHVLIFLGHPVYFYYSWIYILLFVDIYFAERIINVWTCFALETLPFAYASRQLLLGVKWLFLYRYNLKGFFYVMTVETIKKLFLRFRQFIFIIIHFYFYSFCYVHLIIPYFISLHISFMKILKKHTIGKTISKISNFGKNVWICFRSCNSLFV